MHVNGRLAALLEGFNHPSLPGIDLSLDRVKALLAVLGNPQDRLPPIIHVAGTNGKGSTIAFMRAMLEAQGKKVHVYSSPHLVRFNERIMLGGKIISDHLLISVLEQVKLAAQDIPVTFFEATTAAAFLAFSQKPADYVLLEVGLGGRLDATNVITPIASVITPIGLDHQEFLGSTLVSIAAEKAGIIKPGVPVISAPQAAEAQIVIAQEAKKAQAPLTIIDAPLAALPKLEGEHQRWNAALAVATLRAIGPLPDKAIAAGLKNVCWPARLQRLTEGPLTEVLGAVWLDGGHNAHAAEAIAAWAKTKRHPVMLLCGLMARKDAAAFFAPLAGQIDHVVAMPIPHAEDALPPPTIVVAAKAAGLTAEAVGNLDEACALLRGYKPATVLVAGSLYLAGEILKSHE